jgi:hypothetical protein
MMDLERLVPPKPKPSTSVREIARRAEEAGVPWRIKNRWNSGTLDTPKMIAWIEACEADA